MVRVHTDLRNPEHDDLVTSLVVESHNVGVQSCAGIKKERFVRVTDTLESQHSLFMESLMLLLKDLIHSLDHSHSIKPGLIDKCCRVLELLSHT